MSLPDVGVLAGLALLDSTSTGTLTIPAVMLLQPRVRFSRILGYLATISLFYWGLGLALATVGTRITASPGLQDAWSRAPPMRYSWRSASAWSPAATWSTRRPRHDGAPSAGTAPP